MIRPSFVPPAPIRQLRDLTRYRIDLVGERGREKNRVEKLLEDAQIKLSVVASDIFGVSGRAMLHALIAGERDPQVLAQLARARLRTKLPELQEAFVGRFSDHHAFLLTRMLTHIDAINADIAAVEERIDRLVAPLTPRQEESGRRHRPIHPDPTTTTAPAPNARSATIRGLHALGYQVSLQPVA